MTNRFTEWAESFCPSCPTNDFMCPYFNAGLCTIESPNEECEDYISYYEDIQIDPP